MRVAHLWGTVLITTLTACNPQTVDPQPALHRPEVIGGSSITEQAQQPGDAETGPPGFRAGVYSGRVVRRYMDTPTDRLPVEELMKLGSEAYDELLRFEMDRSFMRRYDPAGWDTFKKENRLDDLEIPHGSEVDIGLLIVTRAGRFGFIAGNNPIALAKSAEEPSSLIARARFSGRPVVGEWHAFRKGKSSGIAFRFTPREDSGFYSIRSVSLSNALDEGMGEDVLFYYGLNIFSNRIVVELAVLYWRGQLERRAKASPWPPEEFDLIFQEKVRRDFGGDRRVFEQYLLEAASFLSLEDSRRWSP